MPITEQEAKMLAEDEDNNDIYALYTDAIILWPESGRLNVVNEDLPGTLVPYEIATVAITQIKDGLLILGI